MSLNNSKNAAAKPVIRLDNISKHYQQGNETVRAVDDVTLQILPGDFASITGRSGSGKTTLLSLIGGLTTPSRGEVEIFGEAMSSLDDDALSSLRANRIGFVFQFSSLIPTLTALDNVRLPGMFGEKSVSPKDAADLLAWVGLSDKLQNFPTELSGGQQTRVALARALTNHPSLLLADEPTGNLDVETESEILTLLRNLNRERGMTIVLVTHNPELAQHGTRHLVMQSGKLIENIIVNKEVLIRE
ncbi:MAG: ABC transporter ATP-binding protein [Anaerolineae bacterium]|nr:ABC transporter ATP-binding protein [Anaerolineae bacterium]MBT7325596.1 ABC transporter ATP-binding protein [Anaerolineae bacterium]